MKATRVARIALLGILVATATLAPAGDAPAERDTRLIARGWQPFMALSGDVPRAQSITLLRDGLHLYQTMLMATELAPQIDLIAGDIWHSLEDFDLDDLYHMLPEKQGEWRSLAFSGRLESDSYAVRQIAASELTAPVTQFGQFQALLSMNPNEDPRGTRYSTLMRLQTNTGPVRWISFLEALRLGLANLAEPAPVSAPQSALDHVAAMSPGLSAAEQQILAQLWAAYPASLSWYADIGSVTELRGAQASRRQAEHMKVQLQLNRQALTARYPRVADYLEQLGDFLTAYLVIENRDGRWLTATLDSASLISTIEFWVADGLLVPTRGGRPMLSERAPDFPQSATWRSLLTLTLNAFGVSVMIEDLQTDWRYDRVPDGATITGQLEYVPDVAVDGRLLGILPTSWFEGRLPVSIEGTVDDFMQVLASSNQDNGAQFLMRYNDAADYGSVLKLGADWDGLNNFFVRFGVGMVSDRVLPGAEQARGLQHMFHDALLAWGRDLDGWADTPVRVEQADR